MPWPDPRARYYGGGSCIVRRGSMLGFGTKHDAPPCVVPELSDVVSEQLHRATVHWHRARTQGRLAWLGRPSSRTPGPLLGGTSVGDVHRARTLPGEEQ